MRIYEIDDSYELFEKGIRMGARDLNKASGQGRTIGFEFEVSVHPTPIDEKEFKSSLNPSIDDLVNFIKTHKYSLYNKILPKYDFGNKQTIHTEKLKKDYEENKDHYDAIDKLLNMPHFTPDQRREKYIKTIMYTKALDDITANTIVKKLNDDQIYDRIWDELKHLGPTYKQREQEIDMMLSFEHDYNYIQDEDGNPRLILALSDKEIKDLLLYDDKSIRMVTNAYINDNYNNYIKKYNDSMNDKKYSKEEQAINHTYAVLKKALPQFKYIKSMEYHEANRDGKKWIIEPDASIEPTGAEIISPPMSFDAGINALNIMLDFLASRKDFSTNESTGLHINIGTWPEGEGIDLLKLLLFVGDKQVLKMFDRENNDYALSIVDQAIEFLSKKTTTVFNPDIKYIIMNNTGKSTSLNFSHIRRKGYIEFRAPGGNYLSKKSEIINTIKRYLRAIEVACDPNVYRKEYLSKLYALQGKVSDKSLEKDLKYFKDFNLTADEYKTLNMFLTKNNINIKNYNGITNFIEDITNTPIPKYMIPIITKILKFGIGYDKEGVYDLIDKSQNKTLKAIIADLG